MVSLSLIQTIIHNSVELTFFIIFILCFLIFCYFLGVWISKQRFKKIEIKILTKFDVLKRLPLKHKIFRVSEIAQHSNKFAKDLVVWRTKYEIIYEKKLISCFEVFRKLYALKNRKQLSSAKMKPLYNELVILEQEARKLLTEINEQLQIELLQRDYILSHKVMFNALIAEVEKLKMNVALDEKKINDFEKSIALMFDEFEEYLTSGDFEKTSQILSNITTSLTIFVEILDNIPQIITLLTKVVPNRLSVLKDKYLFFNKDENNRDLLKFTFDELAANVDNDKSLVFRYIDNLQYKKATKKTIEIINMISEFDTTIEQQKKIISCFKKYYKIVMDYINKIERSFTIISKQIEALRSSSVLTEQEESVHRDAMGKVKQLSHDTNKLLLEINKNSRDYVFFNNELIRLLENAVETQNALEEVVKIIEKRNFVETEIRRTIHLLEVVLLQAEVRLNQLQYKNLLNKYQKIISEYRASLERIKKIPFDINKEFEVKDVSVKLNKLKKDVLKLFEKIKNDILLDLLAQEALVYSQKLILTNQSAEKQIKNAQLAYKNHDYESTLYLTIKLLFDVKNNKKNK
ncbi:septation ring formation regulator EzrA [Spiroplasma sp. DGKH1]|uniref:septation ring formation regulator EzrA n=1 Tax=Spiroplasma sp. DGKH1 TaxID=3050074 RepID=UPI0034C63DA0